MNTYIATCIAVFTLEVLGYTLLSQVRRPRSPYVVAALANAGLALWGLSLLAGV